MAQLTEKANQILSKLSEDNVRRLTDMADTAIMSSFEGSSFKSFEEAGRDIALHFANPEESEVYQKAFELLTEKFNISPDLAQTLLMSRLWGPSMADPENPGKAFTDMMEGVRRTATSLDGVSQGVLKGLTEAQISFLTARDQRERVDRVLDALEPGQRLEFKDTIGVSAKFDTSRVPVIGGGVAVSLTRGNTFGLEKTQDGKYILTLSKNFEGGAAAKASVGLLVADLEAFASVKAGAGSGVSLTFDSAEACGDFVESLMTDPLFSGEKVAAYAS